MKKTVKYEEISEKERILGEILESARFIAGKRVFMREKLSLESGKRED